ncbi:MAG: zinc finger Ran-binding domain-containing protein [Sandaracinaceae bacterium]
MASSGDDFIICHVCGFKNAEHAERCVACGARLDEIGADDDLQRRAPQEGFDIRWAVLSFIIYLALQAVALVALPMVIDAYDPQGFSALMITFVVWFFGGALVGFLSARKTFVEPAVGAAFALIPTVYWMVTHSPEAPPELGGGFQLSYVQYMIGGLIGGMLSLFGAFVGEKIQDGTRGRARA